MASLKTGLRPGPQTLGKTNPTKNRPQRKRRIQKEQKLHPPKNWIARKKDLNIK